MLKKPYKRKTPCKDCSTSLFFPGGTFCFSDQCPKDNRLRRHQAEYLNSQINDPCIENGIFVLRPFSDPAAIDALRAYAAATEDRQLAFAIYSWLGEIIRVQGVGNFCTGEINWGEHEN